MAYPVLEAAYGLRPVKRLDGLGYAGATRHLPIASAYGTTLGFGEPVKLASGNIQAAGATDKPVGVFVGCEYTDPHTKQKTWSQSWPADMVAADAMAYVVDDPNALFRVAVLDTGSTAVTGLGRDKVGLGAKLKGLAATNAAGNSTAGIDDGAVAATAGFMLRIIDVVEDSAFDDSGTKYREVLVKINTHGYDTDANFS